jgi:hypothetical protein
MKKERIILIATILLLIFSNLYWFVNDYRTTNREDYYATYDCEQKELIYCIRTYPDGMTYENFKKKAFENKMTFFSEWEEGKNQTVEIRNVLNECPNSGRPYCGIMFYFNNGKLTDIQVGYPCH